MPRRTLLIFSSPKSTTQAPLLNYTRTAVLILSVLGALACSPAAAADEPSTNAVMNAGDAFGHTEGRESIGLYNPYYVRGFSPVSAGNVRIDGLYFSPLGGLSKHVIQSSAIEVGLSAMDDAFPAPTGIANYHLKGEHRGAPGGAITAFAGPWEARGVDLDDQFRADAVHLVVPMGATYQTGASLPHYTSQLTSFGLAPIWTPTDTLTVQGFWDRQQSQHIEPVPIFFTSASDLPPSSATQVRPQPWTDSDSLNQSRGITIRARVSPEWSLAAGIFQANSQSAAAYSDLYLQTQHDGTADHQVVRDANGRSQITSGETQLRWRRNTKHHRHALILSVRARDISSQFGNSDTVDLGQETLGRPGGTAAPSFTSHPQTQQRTDSWVAGVSYRETWSTVGQIAVGVQKALYHEDVSAPDGLRVTRSENPWLLYTSAKRALSSRLTAFTSYTQGLEDSGVAPSTAANRGAILEVARTHQSELGMRYAPSATTSMLISAFDIVKPYVNLDDGNVYRTLGEQQNRGLELSVSTQLGAALHVVAGAVLNHIRVRSDAMSESSSFTAFGQPNTHAIVNVEYQFQQWRSLSLDLGTTYTGATPASTNDRLQLPPTTALDIGGRVRFKILDSSATLRIQAQNLTGQSGWNVGLSPGFTEYPPRRVLAYLTVSI